MLGVEVNTPSPLYPQLITGKYDQISVKMPNNNFCHLFNMYIYIIYICFMQHTVETV